MKENFSTLFFLFLNLFYPLIYSSYCVYLSKDYLLLVKEKNTNCSCTRCLSIACNIYFAIKDNLAIMNLGKDKHSTLSQV